MIDSDKGLFKEFMNTVCGYYQAQFLSTQLLEIYFNGLAPYSFDQVKGAVSKHMGDTKSGQFMPKIADIKKHVEGGVMSTDEILAAARLKQTPFGVLCRIQIGTYDLEHQTDMFYLKQRAQECIDKLPEWRERAISGNYTDHEIETMLKHRVNPENAFHTGLEAPQNRELISGRCKKIWGSKFVGIEQAPTPTPEECKTLSVEGVKVLKELFDKVNGEDK